MKPSSLHDPMQDVASRHAAASPFNLFDSRLDLRLALIALLAVLLVALMIRLRRTDRLDTEWEPRADMTRLIAVVWGGLLFEWVRARFDLATPGFWVASAMLLPFVVGAVVLSLRLLHAYRQTGQAAHAARNSSGSSAPAASKRTSSRTSPPAASRAVLRSSDPSPRSGKK